MRDEDNILALNKLDIDWMGFIFYPGSPRYVPDEDEYLAAIQSCTKIKVGVFVNEQPEEILRKVAKCQLDYVQLHGDESPDDCRHLRDTGCAVIKAISVSYDDKGINPLVMLQQTTAYEPNADYFLFDTKSNQYGGTGKRFNWSVLEAYRGNVPFLLSGGIGMEHVNDLQEFAHPLMAGIDLNSRFELSPALKDMDSIERFVSKFKKNVSLRF
jgi:phosphoribosylanthranilate isomerase